MPGGSKKSRFMQRCVADVTDQGKDTSSAFAICTAQSQKSGYSEPGSTKQTGKGKAREKFFKKQPDMGAKSASYEKAVGRGRNEDVGMRTILRDLEEGRNPAAWQSSASKITRVEAAKRVYEAIRAIGRVRLGIDDLVDAMEGRVSDMPELPDAIRRAAVRALEQERSKIDDVQDLLRAHAESFEEGKWR